MRRLAFVILGLAASVTSSRAETGEVKGRVEMPATCWPSVSPAVVTLTPLDGVAVPPGDAVTEVAVVNQRGLQFEPRVQALQVGQSVAFTNEDGEKHNIHILTPGSPFNQSLGRGERVEFRTGAAGVLRLACDIHSHMRGYVVVSPSPYYRVCRPDGRFRLDAPAGRYRLDVWHEMGQGVSREVAVAATGPTDLGTIAVESNAAPAPGVARAPRPWSEVIDRVSVLLAESRATVARPGGVARARTLVDDAYFEEFEGSDMEVAVRRHLGIGRAAAVENHFRGLRGLFKTNQSSAAMADASRKLILTLVADGEELNRLGVTDTTKVRQGATADGPAADLGDVPTLTAALQGSFDRVLDLANAGAADDAASAMTDVYFDAFEPIERALIARRPQDVPPLEARFNAIRGRISRGLVGEALAADLLSLRREVSDALDRARSGGFAPAFLASLVTIVREGVEVILLLTMLLALVAKAGQPKALTAIRLGLGGAVVASLATAVALNLLVASSQGKAREQIEGWVLMLAAGVLFYVSYWLISQTESRRWTAFLKGQVTRGVAAGGFGTLGLTAFLAVYREGAETALMYQAMLVGQSGSRAGLLGVAAGLAVGLVGLGVIYRLIRTTSVKLPLKTFFKLTGVVLFAMAVVFAGNGVFELQSAGTMRTTPLDWLGSGVPWLGLHPNVQAVSVQGLLLAGAAAAWCLLALDARTAGRAARPGFANAVEPKLSQAAV